jgi:hypothetical protein
VLRTLCGRRRKAEAREGEGKGPPLEMQAAMGEMAKFRLAGPDFFDLRQPMLVSARDEHVARRPGVAAGPTDP